MSNWFFTADEHYGHAKIIEYCSRSFDDVVAMDATLISNHNEVVSCNDTTVHIGDFCWRKNFTDVHSQYISKLNGNHVFIKGSHDKWLPKSAKYMWRKMFDRQLIVACHYPMLSWECSYYGSWQLFGHWHGRNTELITGLQMDVGVDANDFRPVSFDQVREIMLGR